MNFVVHFFSSPLALGLVLCLPSWNIPLLVLRTILSDRDGRGVFSILLIPWNPGCHCLRPGMLLDSSWPLHIHFVDIHFTLSPCPPSSSPPCRCTCFHHAFPRFQPHSPSRTGRFVSRLPRLFLVHLLHVDRIVWEELCEFLQERRVRVALFGRGRGPRVCAVHGHGLLHHKYIRTVRHQMLCGIIEFMSVQFLY